MILADDVTAREKALAQAPAAPAAGLRRDLPGDGGPAGHHPPARSAAPRVPARRSRRQIEELAATMHVSVARPRAADRGPARVQPDARSPRLPPRDHLPGDLRDAGPRDPRGASRRQRRRAPRSAGDHDPARDDARGSCACVQIVDRSSAEEVFAKRTPGHVRVRHDDRAAARRARAPASSPQVAEFFSFGTNDLTQMHDGPLARRRGQVPPGVRRGAASFRRIRSSRSTSTASARSWRLGASSAVAQTEAEHQARGLRRARRRSGQHQFFHGAGARLRVVLTVPRDHRAPGGRSGRGERRGAGAASARRLGLIRVDQNLDRTPAL